jgi:hypothetical protein
VQVIPAQQSVVFAHDEPCARHMHTPDSHSIDPQQSILRVHAPPTPRQQVLVVGDGSQRRPEQQSLAVVQPVSPRLWHTGGA